MQGESDRGGNKLEDTEGESVGVSNRADVQTSEHLQEHDIWMMMDIWTDIDKDTDLHTQVESACWSEGCEVVHV